MSNPATTATAIDRLPLRAAEEAFAHCQSAVVVAPHPDDETLGCGGAIALLRQRSIPVRVLVVSDGTGSHPRSCRYPPSRLRALRQRETRLAVERLGVAAEAVTFWGWRDQQVPHPGTEAFATVVEQCDRYLRRHRPSLLFVPWQGDQHCDHRATWHLVQSALQSWSHPPRQLAYSIWGSRAAGLATLPPGAAGWRLDIQTVESTKRAAVLAYESQTTDLIDDDPDGFRLTAAMLNNLIQPWETYLTP